MEGFPTTQPASWVTSYANSWKNDEIDSTMIRRCNVAFNSGTVDSGSLDVEEDD